MHRFFVIMLLVAAGLTGAGEFPVNLNRARFWKEFPVTLPVTKAELDAPCAALYLEICDLDELDEIALFVNGFGPLNPPASCVSNIDTLPGIIFLPKSWLKEGPNTVTFMRTGDCGGTSNNVSVPYGAFRFGAKAEIQAFQDEKWKNAVRTPDPESSSLPPIVPRALPDRHVFTDDFNQLKPGGEFPYWMPMHGNWEIVLDGKNPVMALREETDNARLLLHVFGQDTELSGKFKLDASPGSQGFYLVTRCSRFPNYMVKCGYNFQAKSWEVVESYGAFVRRNFFSGDAPSNQWNSFLLKMNGKSLSFQLNGKTLFDAPLERNLNYGRAGFLAENTSVRLDDIKVVCEGIPVDGVVEHEFGFHNGYVGSANVLPLSDGRYLLRYLLKGERSRISSDQGKSWIPASNPLQEMPFHVIGTVRLNDGRLLDLEDVKQQKRFDLPPRDLYAKISGDDGKTWQGPYKASNGGINAVMNDKVMQTSWGRIFAASGRSTGGLQEEYIGGVAVQFSDDGKTWSSADRELNLITCGMNVQEPSIVELGKRGHLMMIMRTDMPFLCASISTNDGVSWSNPVPLPLPSLTCAFGAMRAADGNLYVAWTFADFKKWPRGTHFPRERIGLARSTDDGKTWEYLGDVSCFAGSGWRFMNIGLRAIGPHLFVTTTAFYIRETGREKSVREKDNAVMLWRFDIDKLKPYPEFPPLH